MSHQADDRWYEIDRIFGAALAQEPWQRDAFLDRVCRADEELRATVTALLGASARAESFLEAPIFTIADVVEAGPVAKSDVPLSRVRDVLGLSGRQVSHFQVGDVLGCGGMGVVYQAHDLRLGRTVALKFLLPQYSLDAVAKERFLQEARAASILQHLNICTIYDVGETEEKQLFLAMACYGGETLRARLARSGTLAVKEAIELGQQIARGLSAAHAAGVVHRDLKPANLMLTPEGTLKILDFGLAKLRDLSITGPGACAGTVAYMSPEQSRGEPVDARSDLWSVGVVLYEMLTGKVPFGGGHELSTVYRLIHEEPTPVSSVRPDVPADVQAVIEKLLRKQPAERYSNAAELMNDLDAVGGDAASLGVKREGSSGHAVHRRPMLQASRSRRLAVVAGITLVAGLAGGFAVMRQRVTNQPGNIAQPNVRIAADVGGIERKSVAVLPFANLSASQDNEYFSDGITDEILIALANVSDLRVISRTSVMQYKGVNKPLREIASELGVAHVLEGSVQRAGARVRIATQLIEAATDRNIWAERYDRPLEDIFAVQSEIAYRIAEALRAELTETERGRVGRRPTANLNAYDYVLRARELLRRPVLRNTEAAHALLQKATELDPSYADASAALSDAYRWRYWFLGDRHWLDSAAVAARRAIALDPEFARGHAELGWTLDFAGDRAGALQAHRRAVELTSNLSAGLANLSHYGFGRLDEAARWWHSAIERDPTYSLYQWLSASTYLQLGMLANARPLLETALEFYPDAEPPHYFLSTLFLLEGRRDEARAQVQRMLDATRNAPGALLYAGEITTTLGDLPAGRRFFERALGEATDELQRARGTFALAWTMHQIGESEQARTLAQDALAQLEKRWGGFPKRLDEYPYLATIRLIEGDREGALRHLEEAVRLGWRFRNELRIQPLLNALRGEPRLERLLAQVNADVERQRERVEREGW